MHTAYLDRTLLPALALPLAVSAASGLTDAFLLAQQNLQGVTETVAWSGVALSAISMIGVLVRILVNDRQAAREFNARMQAVTRENEALRAENEALHARDDAQQRQIDRLRSATRTNAANIETIARVSGSGIREAPDPSAPPPPAPPPPPDPGDAR